MDQICKGNMHSHSYITLNASGKHSLHSQKFCVNQFISNVTINSSSSEPAIIQCQPNATFNSTTGFGFIHARNLIIENIVFENCGATLSSDALQLVNSSGLYYPSQYSAVLLFNHCWNITLTNVTVKNYYGFAIVAANIFGSSVFENLDVTNSFLHSCLQESLQHPVGSGIVIHYLDSERRNTANYHEVTISQSRFINNIQKENCSSYTNKDYSQPQPISNAAAFTSIYTQNTFRANVTVNSCLFGQNDAGAVLLLHINSHANSHTFMDGNNLTQNGVNTKCHGKSVSVITYMKRAHSLTCNCNGHYRFQYRTSITNTQIYNHITETKGGTNQENHGILYFSTVNDNAMSQTIILLRNVSFQKNVAQHSGAGIYAISLWRGAHNGDIHEQYYCTI